MLSVRTPMEGFSLGLEWNHGMIRLMHCGNVSPRLPYCHEPAGKISVQASSCKVMYLNSLSFDLPTPFMSNLEYAALQPCLQRTVDKVLEHLLV